MENYCRDGVGVFLQDWSTCWDDAFLDNFSEDSSSPFYMPAVNYFDVTCRNGDGMFGGHRQPCSWLSTIEAAI